MECKVFDLGLKEFIQVVEFQDRVIEEVRHSDYQLGLIIYRSQPVITLGRNSPETNILIDRLQKYRVSRGGDVTYHGPGQLIAFPVFNLKYLKKDINLFLRSLEEVVIRMLDKFGVSSQRCKGSTGVWVSECKISSIGVAFSHWISSHGVAVNVKRNDLYNYSFIRPCGMDIEMTSLESELGREVDMEAVKQEMLNRFKEVFNMNLSLA